MTSHSALLSLIESFPVSASLKEADTGKYIINNAHNARQFGVENPADLVGLTIRDIDFQAIEVRQRLFEGDRKARFSRAG